MTSVDPINPEAEQSGAIQTAQTLVSQPLDALQPVSVNERIHVLDILRGFALIGILLMNIEWFGRPISELGSFNSDLTGLDHAVGWLIRCFVEGKFYKLFALLFGMGFAVMLTQAMEKGRPFGAWFIRRMLVLFVIGMLHMVFIWEGDILHDYAVAGLLFLGLIYLFRTPSFENYNNPSSILKVALWWLSLPIILTILAGTGFGSVWDRQSLAERWEESEQIAALVQTMEQKAKHEKLVSKNNTLDMLVDSTAKKSAALNENIINATEKRVPADTDTRQVMIEKGPLYSEPVEQDSADNSDENEQAPTPEQQAQSIIDEKAENQEEIALEIAALKKGSYWQATVYRANASLFQLAITPLFVLGMLLPIFMMGYWLVASGVIRNHMQYPRLFRQLARVGLGVGLSTTVAGLMVMEHPAVERITLLQGVGNGLFTIGQFFMAAGYLGLLVRLLAFSKWSKILHKLVPFGRMALTNYILQSVILTSIFYGYAGGMYGEISRAPQMLIVLAILVVQIPLSSWWLKHYQFGPLEWVWRSLTYKRWQSFKQIAAQSA
jgi:uncharacterized protein